MISGQWFWLEKDVIRNCLVYIGASGLAVYCFLASCSDEHQTCFPSQSYIAKSLGCSRSTVCRALAKLEKAGCIRREPRIGGGTDFTLIAIPPGVKVEKGVDKINESCTEATDLPHQCNKIAPPADTNNNQRIIYINNDLESINRIASFLADALGNPESTGIYETYARKYPEVLLRKVLTEVKETPYSQIRESRSQLFTHLLNKSQ